MNIARFDLALEKPGAAQPSHLSYRPDIDGLRALAVLPVLIYHAFPSLLPGGFFGVDIFFVISGYLITGIIHQQMREKRFSIANFYARRIRRIFPALILVVTVTFAIGWFLLPLHDMQSLGTNIAGGAIFAQNFVLLGQVGYFDLAANMKPLLHLWSLGIEEQYYVAWPLTLLLIRRWNLNGLAVVTVLAVTSFVLCLIVGARAPDYAFYLPVTRAWELLVGSALALWHGGRIINLEQRKSSFRPSREIAAACALAAIVVSLCAYRAWMRDPGWFTLLPVLGAAALIGGSGTFVHRHLLAARPAVFVGLISYPLYLWHFPLMAYARIHFVDGVRIRYMLAILLASGLLAWLTYRIVEKPLRFGRKRVRIKVAGLITAMLALGIVGLAADRTNGLPIRIPASVRPFMLTGAESSQYWREGKCLMQPEQSPAEFAPECAGNGGRPLLFIWGDSYAASLYPGLKHFAAKRGFDVAEYTASACAPLIGYVNPERRFCKPSNDYALKRIAELRPDVVILYSTWSYSEPDLRGGLQRTVPLLRPFTKKIVLLGPPASWTGEGLSANVLDYYFESGGAILPERTWYRSNDRWTRQIESILEPESAKAGIDYISMRRLMCNNDGCLARIGPNGSELTAFDGGHLTHAGSIFMAGQVIDRLLDFKH
ncbi:MAG TPA: acyltransferase family protein [Bradyrhizobium sp.]|uniref:acyltransferase family protein n=1 Tax=Bradyrhizobium sp. TaxID=376 RepID=UPI002C1FCF1A|nr:acyltransferase family protein [Bradyrhizobium sp.]HLZ03203.1 acyltransferase family protein [Bradyrhizobium sp.]